MKDMIERINRPIKKFGRLNLAYVRVTVLFDFITVINDNSDQLTSPTSLQVIATNQEAAQQLYDYIILEIASFYYYIKELIKKNPQLTFPKLPDYYGQIFKFRSAIPGHLDKNENLSTGKDFTDIYKEIFTDIGIPKIAVDFENYYEKCRKQFGKEFM